VYVISLQSRPDRLAACTAQLRAPAKVVRAVDGHTLRMCAPSMTRGETGCFLSHATALQRIADGPDAAALVLEDDCVLPAQWPERVAAVMASAPAGWGAIALGCNFVPPDAAPGLIELGATDLYGAHAILYSQHGARAYLAAVRAHGFREPYDTWLSRCRAATLLVANPPIAKVRSTRDSDTQRFR